MKYRLSTDSPVVIIGAGIAGLCASLYLKNKKIPHIILEKGEIANTWEKERWDNFYLVNPNWAIKIPEFGFGTKSFPSKNPDGFLNKRQTIDYIKSFATYVGSKIYTNENVNSITKKDGVYKIITSKRTITSDIIIVASGAFGDPYTPKISSKLDKEVFQIHSSNYNNSATLPEGDVLVVGSGQSGAQIAEDLIDSGRNVSISVSRCGRRLRNYRGKDSSWWNYKMGLFDKTIHEVPFKDRWKCSSHTSGSMGGHEINLMDLKEKGLKLFGSVHNCSPYKIIFQNNLYNNLKFSDDSALSWSKKVDDYILKNSINAPKNKIIPDARITEDIYSPKKILLNESPKNIIWSTGFRYNFSWIKLKLTDKNGHPIQKRGVTKYNGLYFMGLQWMHTSKSAQFIGVGEDAEFIINDIESKYLF